MKRFLRHSILFLALVLGSMLLVFWQADGYSDAFYVRFTTPPQKSLILGTSKAAQGIRPEVFNQNEQNPELFNYAFTVAHSPYGPSYLKGIQRKLAEGTHSGVFIVTVDAWSISDSGIHPDDETQFDENKSFLNKLQTVSSRPNIPYLLHFYKNQYAKILDRDPVAFLHDDGWLEITLPMKKEIVAKRIQNKAVSLAEKMQGFQFSETRLSYLYKTIEYVKEHGDVFLVRLPVHPSLQEADTAVVPDFDELMQQLAADTGIPYLDLLDQSANYRYTDGIHLYKTDALEVSELIRDWMHHHKNPKG